MTTRCRICGNDAGNSTFTAREMMLATRDAFEYVECAACGTLQIAEFPEAPGRYYPENYYSLQGSGRLERSLKARWMAASLGGSGLLGRVLVRVYGPHPVTGWQHHAGFTLDSPILDVGCGEGELLRTMKRVGFTDLTGVDPFLTRERRAPGLRLLRGSLDALEGPFEFIMMHHSLEHMREPRAALEAVARLLPTGGTLLVRTPVAGTYAWRTYGRDWIQLDAPRHLHVLSERALRLLADRTGYRLERVVYDSSAFQFWGSELYAADIPYRPKPSYRNRPSRTLISREQMKRYHARARELNARSDGDSAAFYLRRVRS
ncbi:MAG: class I SAM-dependent methyltransferase [Gemmatimonadota bacterium]